MTEAEAAANPDDEVRAAGIEYVGVAGSSPDCLEAVKALLQTRRSIEKAWIVTAGTDHGLIMVTTFGDPIAIKDGFASGYGGTGPKAFSTALNLLDVFGVEIDEVLVEKPFLERLDQSALTVADVDRVKSARPVRPERWPDYVFDTHFDAGRKGAWLQAFNPIMPFHLIDPRLADLARDFWTDPDRSLTVGYRRLEDAVRARTGLASHSTNLFREAFGEKKGALTWAVETGEKEGRNSLFAGVFKAYRNPRAHRVLKGDDAQAEFLLLNHLFRLEADAVPVEDDYDA